MRNFMMKAWDRFRKEEDGVTLVEYGIAVTLAVLVGAAALSTLATEINNELGEATSIMQ